LSARRPDGIYKGGIRLGFPQSTYRICHIRVACFSVLQIRPKSDIERKLYPQLGEWKNYALVVSILFFGHLYDGVWGKPFRASRLGRSIKQMLSHTIVAGSKRREMG
jgi:hypothetical protein